MSLLRAIIVDDEQKGIDILKILLDKFVPQVKIVAESTRPQQAIELIESYQPEIVFLDINMPEFNGFELLEKLTWRTFNLIFVTAHQEHALKALKINAIDYLLKPVDHEDLIFSINRILNKINNNETANQKFNFTELLKSVDNMARRKIIVNSKSGLEYIDLHDMVSLESKSNHTQITLTDGRNILTSRGLKEFEAELCVPNVNFMRVHHSYIVNLEKVGRFIKTTDDIIMVNEQKIPLAKSKKEKFVEWLSL